MKKTVSKILSYILVALVAAGTTAVCFVVNQYSNTSKLQEVEYLLTKYYIGEADQKVLEDAAADAMVQALGDRWSYYMTKEQYQSYLEVVTNSYVGVGITIQVREDGQGFDIREVVEGGPAQQAGVAAGDVLVAVEGREMADMTANELSSLIRGEEGTQVKVTVLRDGRRMEFALTRKRFQTPVATGKMLADQIGLITIENFDERCAEESIAAIETLLENGAEKLIFDVRHNPGGFADELVKLLDYLLPEGDLFRTVRYDGKEHVDTSDADCLEMPMAVLVNSASYSAAEFFAAALREYEAAVVVGEQTVGKGYFQITYQLSDGSAVALSIGEYFTPKGENLAGVGITPDVIVPVEEKVASEIYYGTLEPEEDPQIQAAVKALK